MHKYPDHPNYKPLTPDHPEFVPQFRIGVPKQRIWEDAMDKLVNDFKWFAEVGAADAIEYNVLAEREYGKYVAALQARLEEMRKPDAKPVASMPLPPTRYNLKLF